MKTWNAPEMEELDVRMTLTGSYSGYKETQEGYEQWFQETYPGVRIPDYNPDWNKDHNHLQAS